MPGSEVTFHSVTFTYELSSQILLESLTLHFPTGWTGIVGANGSGKTTVLRLATGELTPQQGQIRSAPDAMYCPQRTDFAPANFSALLKATEAESWTIRSRLGIGDDWLQRWNTLSHGERKRAQLATALWLRPQALAVDEPTNHLDGEARRLISDALTSFDGVGLLVSHDRELLDRLCHQCLFLDPPMATMRPGSYSEAARQARIDEESQRRQRRKATVELRRLQREATRRSQEAVRSHRRRSKRGLGKDPDARSRLDLARVTGRDGVAGKLRRQLDGRLQQARLRQERIRVRKTHELGIWIEGSRSRRDTLLELSAGTLPLGPDRRLTFAELVIKPDDRIALSGPNGAGKSTLVRRIVDTLDLPSDRLTYVPQEIGVSQSKEILDQLRSLSGDRLGHTMAVVSRLGSRPDRLLESVEPSPGEIRKILLALGISQGSHLILMDEPTNHMDLPSIECLEKALADCPCALLLVSHDEVFLKRLCRVRWHIAWEKAPGNALLQIKPLQS